MDPYVHTIIAVVLLYISFVIGKFVGRVRGAADVFDMIMDAHEAVDIWIDHDDVIHVLDEDGVVTRIGK